MIEQILLDGSVQKVYSKDEWISMCGEYFDKIFEEKGDMTGLYCCGYHWCCDECVQEICRGCADCALTMYKIYESFGYEVDRSDLDFAKFENRTKELYEKYKGWK